MGGVSLSHEDVVANVTVEVIRIFRGGGQNAS